MGASSHYIEYSENSGVLESAEGVSASGRKSLRTSTLSLFPENERGWLTKR